MSRVAALAAAGALVALAVPALSPAAVPANRHDPCAHAGHDSCRTTGVGFYRTYRYGIRWFGDFRNAVPGQKHLFCLDLRFWYASPRYRYRTVAAATLRNKDGERVRAAARHRIAYAIWRFGRSGNARRQAAVMLYVHGQMGDARPGEVAPTALGRRVAVLYRRIARDAARFHGPYRIVARLPGKLVVGRRATASLRVLAAGGKPLPYVRLTLSPTGADGIPKTARTNAAGIARVAFTPTAAAGLQLRIVTEPLAAAEPHVLAPTRGAARANGQRLAAPSSRRVTSSVSHPVVAAPVLTAKVSAPKTTPGQTVTSTVTVTGTGGGSVPVQVQLYGPYSSPAGITCSGKPYWSGSFVAAGDTTTTTAGVTLDQAGYYAYHASVPEQASNLGATTSCAATAQTTFAKARPALDTVASPEIVRPGSRVSDLISVTGLGKTPAVIRAELYGPFPSRAAVRCRADKLAWKGRVPVTGNGKVRTPRVEVSKVGFYGFRETLAASTLVTGTATPCAPSVEMILAAPEIVTGRGDVSRYVAAHAAGGARPVRLQVGSLRIDAPVLPSAIDLRHGVLGIPSNIHRIGWWRDGSAPGARKGTILLAGHVDSATAGRGALFTLHRVRKGGRVRLAAASGRTFSYRVVSVRSYPKRKLPTTVFSREGRARLVIVTCGGRFNEATGHYPDVVVVTAVPVR